MKRKIKFRAWDKSMKKMLFGAFLFGSEGFRDVLDDKGECLSVIPPDKNIDNYEIMQLTNLKDKIGKEIYEGDIVKIREGTFFWGNPISEDQNFLMDRVDYYETDEFGEKEDRLIIGNIYENPEIVDYVK